MEVKLENAILREKLAFMNGKEKVKDLEMEKEDLNWKVKGLNAKIKAMDFELDTLMVGPSSLS